MGCGQFNGTPFNFIVVTILPLAIVIMVQHFWSDQRCTYPIIISDFKAILKISYRILGVLSACIFPAVVLLYLKFARVFLL